MEYNNDIEHIAEFKSKIGKTLGTRSKRPKLNLM